MKRTVATILCLGPAVALIAADRPHFDSHPVDGAITVDGNFDDWKGSAGGLEPFGKDPVSIQVLNDGTFLYVRLSASDPGVRAQIVRRGLTVWFDPKGGTKKAFGVRYPVIETSSDDQSGIGGYGGFGGRRRPQGGDSGGDSGSAGASTTGAPSDTSEQPPDRVDILGPGKNDEVSLTREALKGVDVAFQTEQGVLQYELKVPLAKTEDLPYAIGVAPGKTIGIGLETPKPQQRFTGGSGGGFGGGGMGGGMGGRGGGFGGRGGGMGGRRGGGGERGFQPPKPLKGWGTLTLK